jgi:hypothetical protein
MSSSTESDMDVILQRRLRAYELALDTARRDAVAAAQTLSRLTARIAEQELALSDARERPRQLEAQLSESRRARRSAEQRAYAERVHREELQDQLAELAHGREQAVETLEEFATAEARHQELVDEVAMLRRSVDEADHLAGVSVTARERAEQHVAELTAELDAVEALRGQGLTATIVESLRTELELADQLRDAGPAPAPVPVPRDAFADSLALERELLADESRAPVAAAPDDGSSRRLLTVLRGLRPELSTLAAMLQREHAARILAERRLGELEQQLGTHLERANRAFTPPNVSEALVVPEGPINPERLAEALKRLRTVTGAAIDEGTAASDLSDAEDELTQADTDRGPTVTTESAPAALTQVETAPADAVRPWLRPSFRRLARYDPDAAGRLVLALLPLQAMAHHQGVAYDIGSAGDYMHVTVRPDGQRIEPADRPRPAGDVDFSVEADPAALAALMTAGRLRRRLGFGLPKVRGDRHRLGALDALLSVPLFTGELAGSGVELDPVIAMKLVGAMIGRDPTNGKVFTLGFRSSDADRSAPAEVALLIDGARRPEVIPDLSAPTTTIVCEPERLLAALTDMSGTSFTRIGARDPLSWVQRRLKAAESV